MIKVGVIGGGPAGIVASICLKEKLHHSAEVILFEKKKQIGKKILASGNGKCNLSNKNIPTNDTYNHHFASLLFKKYDNQALKDDFLRWGLLTKDDASSRTYPITESSKSVLEILMRKLKEYQVKIKLDTLVTSVNKLSNGLYEINTSTSFKPEIFDYVIFATGGASSPQLGSNGEGYQLLKALHVLVSDIKPGLVGLKTSKNDVLGLDGIRQKVRLTLQNKFGPVFTEEGEVQFKKDGISGIVVMNASSIIARSKEKLNLSLDLLPFRTQDELIQTLELLKDSSPKASLNELCYGILPMPLADKICKDLKQQKELTIGGIVNEIKNYSVNVIGNYGFETSQVTIGGVKLDEIDANFELKKIINTYVIGELLDVDGLCGGYNLHFAIASGVMVAHTIYEKEREKNENKK